MSYITINLLDGIGKQLFQIAMILHLIKRSKYDRKLVFKQSEANDKSYFDTLFKDQFNILSEDEYNKIQFIRHEINKENLPYDNNEDILIDGYIPSFANIDNKLRNQIIEYVYSNEDLMYNAYDKYNEIKMHFGTHIEDNEMISMHIRRTEENRSSGHNDLYLDYYKKALEIADKKYIVVFSDDIEWCKNNIAKNFYKYESIYFVDIDDSCVEFILMSMFQHNIISNSVYSLWASFISSYKDKIVIAPKLWYHNDEAQTNTNLYHKSITHII